MLGGKKNGNGEKIDESGGRTLCMTESTWCKAVSGGTGIVVLTFQVSKATEIVSFLQNGLRHLQHVHPILRSKLHYDTRRKVFSFVTPPPSTAAASHDDDDDDQTTKIKVFDISSTSELIRSLSKRYNYTGGASKEKQTEEEEEEETLLSPIHMIQEHEMNKNVWLNPSKFPEEGMEVCFATVYVLPGSKWIVALRLHAAACDRTTAESLLKELLEFAEKRDDINNNNNNAGKYCSEHDSTEYACCFHAGVEDLIPSGKTKKTIWVHGLDVLEYSLNSFKLTNLKFRDVEWPRCSEIVRLKMNSHYTNQLLGGCKSRGIKFFGVVAAAGLMAAAHSSSKCSNQKYAVATLIDCRTLLDPPLATRDYGFYHSAIVNTHSISAGTDIHEEKLWNLATRCYTAVENSKKRNKHFSDMADLNFLMRKVMENPSLTASSSLRTSLIAVFEEPVMFDGSDKIQQELGLQDYIGCSSAHGVGPSVAFFDTIRDGQLDCVCVYPSPLHSRDQMIDLIDKMKRILIDAVN